MSSWLVKNLSLIFVSLVLAFFFWAVATEAEDPTKTQTFPTPIPVEIRGLPDGMTTYGAESARVRVEITAPQSVWDRLQVEDFQAYIDLSSVETGTVQAPVQVVIDVQPAKIASITPKDIQLTVENVAEKDVPVVVRVQGSPALGFTAGQRQVAPESVRVRGPQSKVDQVTEALVIVSVADLQNDLRADYKPVPVDRNESEVLLVEVVPNSVTVYVPVTQWLDTRDVPVDPTIVGQPAPGYRVADIEYSPQVLTVYGRADVLDTTTAIQTDPVNMEGITQTLETTVALRLPTGLFVFSSESSASITLTIEAVRSGLNLEITPTVRGLGPNLTVTVGLDTVIVILSGPLSEMEALDPSTVQAVLDLTGYAPGEYSITPTIVVPNAIDVENITPQAVPVRIEAVVPPTGTTGGLR